MIFGGFDEKSKPPQTIGLRGFSRFGGGATSPHRFKARSGGNLDVVVCS